MFSDKIRELMIERDISLTDLEFHLRHCVIFIIEK